MLVEGQPLVLPPPQVVDGVLMHQGFRLRLGHGERQSGNARRGIRVLVVDLIDIHGLELLNEALRHPVVIHRVRFQLQLFPAIAPIPLDLA